MSLEKRSQDVVADKFYLLREQFRLRSAISAEDIGIAREATEAFPKSRVALSAAKARRARRKGLTKLLLDVDDQLNSLR